MTRYAVDLAHSSIGFSVKHMMISKVTGLFDSYSAKIEAVDIANLADSTIQFEIDVASVSTRDAARDNHLISADFFHADRFPKITFVKTAVELVDARHFRVTGALTIKDVTRPVTFDVTYTGHVTNPWGAEAYGFSCTAILNRKDFQLTYNSVLESGGFLIDENVVVSVELELNPI
ncbi:YceI family protein [Solibacillus sp. FSL H8-0538]|uniref:YceI family protein n=1 Tax=Solibacillus sp. FSL H8-0538 TaxID=2921400 RepID=UPI0030F54605